MENYKFRRRYWVDLFFVCPFAILIVSGIYKVLKGKFSYEFYQIDQIVYGVIMILIGVLFLAFTAEEVFIEFDKKKLKVRNILGVVTKEVCLDKVKSQFIKETETKGVNVRELVLYDGLSSHFVSLFGHGVNTYKIEQRLKLIKSDDKLNKKFFVRDLKLLGKGLIFFVIIITMVMSIHSKNGNEFLEESRVDASNTTEVQTEICNLRKGTKRKSSKITKIKFDYCQDDNYTFIFQPEALNYGDLNILFDKMEMSKYKVTVEVNEDLFNSKFNGTRTEMSYKEMHVSYDVIEVYSIIVDGQKFTGRY